MIIRDDLNTTNTKYENKRRELASTNFLANYYNKKLNTKKSKGIFLDLDLKNVPKKMQEKDLK